MLREGTLSMEEADRAVVIGPVTEKRLRQRERTLDIKVIHAHSPQAKSHASYCTPFATSGVDSP